MLFQTAMQALFSIFTIYFPKPKKTIETRR